MNDYLMIGEVLKPQGIRGEAKVKPYAADPQDFMKWKTLYIQSNNEYEPITARCSRVHDGFAYITLGDCTDPNAVERLRGMQLYIRREQTVQPSGDETFICDLIGCEAVDETGAVLGTLTDVLQHGPVDVYVFRTPKGSLMAPALKAVFPAVDVTARRISVCTEKLQEVAVVED